ncbi:MAG TPA: AbrB/MazE/SpoVT family DNA-binding domain-containing protein [Thermaerobacter sp.]
MRAVGIVRAVDDLGRLVIPKSLRDQLGIVHGTKLAISVDEGGRIILQPTGDTVADRLARVLQRFVQATRHPAVVTASDWITLRREAEKALAEWQQAGGELTNEEG